MNRDQVVAVVRHLLDESALARPLSVEDATSMRDWLVPVLAPLTVEVFHRHTEMVIQVFDGRESVLSMKKEVPA